MTYRADIDGLRAIAILFVLSYPAGLTFFPSGYIGVDIFFVISGFLISSIIIEGIDNNRFSFIDFYNRRLWRLQPLFICLIVISTIMTLLFYLPEDLNQYTRSARKTSLFLSNNYFAHTTTGYFSPNTNQLPLLHTWSLSVEWQCYFVLPLALYLLQLLLGKTHLKKGVFILTLAFFILSLYFSSQYPAKTYYQFPSRIFEFLIGSCVVFMPKKVDVKPNLLSALGIASVLILFYVARIEDIKLGYPNWYTLLVCLATGALILIGNASFKSILTRLLSRKPLVFLGMLSYSLYIWHWLVFALLRYASVEETTRVLLGSFSLIFVLSFLSWQFIEKPTRRYNHIKFSKSLVILVLIPIIFTHTSSFLINKNDGFPQRFNDELVRIYQQLNQTKIPQRPLCIGNTKINYDCLLGDLHTQTKTGMMIGDSFSNHYWGFVDTLAKQAQVSILSQGVSSCLTLPGIYLFDWWHNKNQIYKKCHDQTAYYFNAIKMNHYNYVILGQIWENYLGDHVINHQGDERSLELSEKRIEAALDEALQIITNTGAVPILIKTTALMNSDFHDCFFKHIKMRTSYDPAQCSYERVQSESVKWFDALFNKMVKKYATLIIIDPAIFQCPEGRCRADMNGIPVYRDVGHITDYASYQLGRLYLQKFNNPLIAYKGHHLRMLN